MGDRNVPTQNITPLPAREGAMAFIIPVWNNFRPTPGSPRAWGQTIVSEENNAPTVRLPARVGDAFNILIWNLDIPGSPRAWGQS